MGMAGKTGARWAKRNLAGCKGIFISTLFMALGLVVVMVL
jgi:hypothetical protein